MVVSVCVVVYGISVACHRDDKGTFSLPPILSYNIGPGVLVRQQVPLKLSWATTVHKSQGSTLTRAILDISSCFEVGQAYVSLSRVKSINGLYLERRVSMNNILVSERVLDYYNMKR